MKCWEIYFGSKVAIIKNNGEGVRIKLIAPEREKPIAGKLRAKILAGERREGEGCPVRGSEKVPTGGIRGRPDPVHGGGSRKEQ